MNMIQFSNGVLAENGNVQNRVHIPLPSFNPTPEQFPGIKQPEHAPAQFAAEHVESIAEHVAAAQDAAVEKPVETVTPVAATPVEPAAVEKAAEPVTPVEPAAAEPAKA